jgi:hypothetical protein
MSRVFNALPLALMMLWLPTTAASSSFLETMTEPHALALRVTPQACKTASGKASHCPADAPYTCAWACFSGCDGHAVSPAPCCPDCGAGCDGDCGCGAPGWPCPDPPPTPPTPPPTPSPTYDCEVTPTAKKCVEKYDGKGGFPTLGACQANPLCGPSTYACLVNQTFTGCVKKPAGQGPFPTRAACNKTCAPPVPTPGQ